MSAGVACKCTPETRRWYVTARYCNYSKFNGGHRPEWAEPKDMGDVPSGQGPRNRGVRRGLRRAIATSDDTPTFRLLYKDHWWS